ncbi:MAG: hypothetical protein U1F43_30465 [Myxococcota bacterium]
MIRSILTASSLAWCLLACSGDDAEPAEPRIELRVAPLSLSGIGFACFDVRVDNGAGPVWSRGDPALTRFGADQTGGANTGAPDLDALCSDAFGNGARGDVAYVGPCDATSDSDGDRAGVQNRVTLWVDALASADGSGDIGGWSDPCPDGCALTVDCVADRDTPVTFDLTIARRAEQGFFDVAVDFDDIFCSAKVDTCYAAPDGARIELLFGADWVRDWTAVAGLACTAGPGGAGSELLYGPVAVTCGGVRFPLDLTAEPGNQRVTVGARTLHYGVYRGSEGLDCDVRPCDQLFWNFAVSLDDLQGFGLGECRLAFEATATRPGAFAAGLPSGSGVAWPYVTADVALTDGAGSPSCQRHALGAGDPALRTTYAGALAGLATPRAMCLRFAGDAAVPTGACAADGDPDPAGTLNPCPTVGESVATNGAAAAIVDPGFTNIRLFPLDKLQCITTIAGNLYVAAPFTGTSLGMASLRTVGGNVYVISNATLASLSLPQLATVAGSLTVAGNAALGTLSLPSLASLGSFLINGNGALTSVSLPLLAAKPDLRGEMAGNEILETLSLPQLTSVGQLSLWRNHKLSTCALRQLMSQLGGPNRSFRIFDNLRDCPDYDGALLCPEGPETVASVLIDASHPAPDNLACIHTVTGSVTIDGAAESDLAFPMLVSAGSLSVTHDAALTSLSMPELASAGPITIADNAVLSYWDAPRLDSVASLHALDNPRLSTCALRTVLERVRPQSPDAEIILTGDLADCPAYDSTAPCPNGPETVFNLIIDPSSPPPANLACIAAVTSSFQIYASDIEAIEMPLLTHVGILSVDGNASLRQLSFPTLTSLAWLQVSRNAALTSIDLGAVTGGPELQVGIEANPLLASVDLAALDVVDSLSIVDNPALSTCGIYPLAAQVHPVHGVVVRDNAPDCSYPCAGGSFFDGSTCAACDAIPGCPPDAVRCTSHDDETCP